MTREKERLADQITQHNREIKWMLNENNEMAY